MPLSLPLQQCHSALSVPQLQLYASQLHSNTQGLHTWNLYDASLWWWMNDTHLINIPTSYRFQTGFIIASLVNEKKMCDGSRHQMMGTAKFVRQKSMPRLKVARMRTFHLCARDDGHSLLTLLRVAQPDRHWSEKKAEATHTRRQLHLWSSLCISHVQYHILYI